MLDQGDRLGRLGSTGHSTGPHVHYEVRNSKGTHINPVTLLWASEIQGVMICANALRDMPATTRALVLALDVASLGAP